MTHFDTQFDHITDSERAAEIRETSERTGYSVAQIVAARINHFIENSHGAEQRREAAY